MTVPTSLVERAAAAWGLDTGGFRTLREEPNLIVMLPACDAVLRFFRPEVSRQRVEGLHRARAVLHEAEVPTVPLLTTVDGPLSTVVDGRVVEAELRVVHDGRMNTPRLFTRGAALLAALHNAWEHVRLPPDTETCDWANWISPDRVVAGVRAGVERVAAVPDLDRLRANAVRLSSLVAEEPAGLPRQLVHGDFWDDNVYVSDGRLVAVSDFDFVARRSRIDDLALLLYFADEQPTFEGVLHRDAETRIGALRPLVEAYRGALASPLTDAERQALPFALARQSLWSLGGWVPVTEDDRKAENEARSLAGPVDRSLQVAEHPDLWRDGLLAP